MADSQEALIADDDPVTLQLIAHFLRTRGFQVWTAGTGERLWELWRTTRSRIVLSDIEMPGVQDGILACRAIQRADPSVRIFLMTARPENRLRAAADGFQVALVKPFSLDELRLWADNLHCFTPQT